MDIVNRELESTKHETKIAIQQGKSKVETLEALSNLAELRLQDVKREVYEFKRDVVVAGNRDETLSGKIPAERVVKFYEDKIRDQNTLIDKLRVKNNALRAQQAKLAETLASKESASGVSHYIDFHQLQIENTQHLNKIEEKNAELLRLKLTTGNAVASLNQLKGRLGELSKEAARLKHDIKARTALLSKLRVENDDLSTMVARQQELAAKLTSAARGAEDMPQTLDYVELTRTQAALEHEINSWQRKVEIASLKAKTQRGHGSRGGIETATTRTGTSAILNSPHGQGLMGFTGDGFGQTINSSFFGSPYAITPNNVPNHHKREFSAGATMTGAAARTPASHVVPSHTPGPTHPITDIINPTVPSSSNVGSITTPGKDNILQHPPISQGMLPPPSTAFQQHLQRQNGGPPNLGQIPVAFGSTTVVTGVSGTRPMGGITGVTKGKSTFRSTAAIVPRGVGGFGGGVVSKLSAQKGQLALGRPPKL